MLSSLDLLCKARRSSSVNLTRAISFHSYMIPRVTGKFRQHASNARDLLFAARTRFVAARPALTLLTEGKAAQQALKFLEARLLLDLAVVCFLHNVVNVLWLGSDLKAMYVSVRTTGCDALPGLMVVDVQEAVHAVIITMICRAVCLSLLVLQ